MIFFSFSVKTFRFQGLDFLSLARAELLVRSAFSEVSRDVCRFFTRSLPALSEWAGTGGVSTSGFLIEQNLNRVLGFNRRNLTVRPKNRSQMSSRALVRSTCDQIIDFPSEISSRKSDSMTFPSVSSPVPGRFPLLAPLGFPLGPLGNLVGPAPKLS